MFLKELPLRKVDSANLKIKLFIRHTLDDVERDVNEWMEQNDIRICHVTQSQSEKQGRFVFVISVFYQPAT